MLFEEIKKSNSVKSNLVYIEKDINKAIEKISSIIKNKGKLVNYYFVEMEVQLQMHNT